MGKLLVNLFHPLDVEPAALCMVDHGFGVIHPHHAVGCLLERLGGVPWLVDVAVWVILEDGDVMPAKNSKAHNVNFNVLYFLHQTIADLKHASLSLQTC